LHGRKGSMEHLNNIQNEVAAFVGSAPQSDDLTMLFIHYLGNSHENRITLDNDIKQIPRLEGFVNAIASRHGLSEADASGINLALEEAVTNVVLYAYPQGKNGRIDLDSQYVDGRLEFILSDSGIEFDPTKAPDVNVEASLEDRKIGGLGIHLVKTIMDSVSYERKGGKNVLTMIKNI
ncbi:MAG: ATP-binding protein, partial [Bacteroidales bacterium]|nr:ATP-binding protein [Bacteroidales bacterium]